MQLIISISQTMFSPCQATSCIHNRIICIVMWQTGIKTAINYLIINHAYFREMSCLCCCSHCIRHLDVLCHKKLLPRAMSSVPHIVFLIIILFSMITKLPHNQWKVHNFMCSRLNCFILIWVTMCSAWEVTNTYSVSFSA